MNKTYQKNPSVVCTELDDGAVLLNLETKCHYNLNQTGLRIWQLIDRFSDPMDVAQRIANEYAVDPGKALAGVFKLTEQLEQEEIIFLDEANRNNAQNDFILALTGDSIITQRLSIYEEAEFLSLIDVIRSADMAFTNLEVLIHSYEGYPAAENHGTYMAAQPFIANELKWIGFNIVSRANNHAMDYGIEGLLTTSKILDEVGLVHAGVGENLALARAPAYLETKRGRVALISCSSTFPTFFRAGEQRCDLKGRPGLNPLRYNTTYVIDPQFMGEIKRISSALKLPLSESEESLKFLGHRFTAGDFPRVTTAPDESDLRGNIESIKEAKRQADLVLVSHHAHEMDRDIGVPAEFIITFARASIDAGADVFIGHGPHVVRGIEIYKGKPIFYGLGNFMFQYETVKFHPAEAYERYGLDGSSLAADLNCAREKKEGRKTGFSLNPIYWVSVLPQVTFRNGIVYEIKLYPISLEFGKPVHKRGRPILAHNVLGQKIIDRIKQLSSSFGAEIAYEDGIGVVNIKR